MFPKRIRIPGYDSWAGMIARCKNPNNENFQRYGGRGISVCDRWLLFDNFLADMGPRPPKTTIERRENDKGYSPENCYWGNHTQQIRNRRNTIFLVFHGERRPLAELAEARGVPYARAYLRFRAGLPTESILAVGLLPSSKKGKKGRPKVPKQCPTCGEMQAGTREAWAHCRTAASSITAA